MSKQDRQGVRTAPDLERKYNFNRSFREALELSTLAKKTAEEALVICGDLSKFIPNGYATAIDSLDNASTFGLTQSSVGAPTTAMWDCLTIPYSNTFATQIAFKTNQSEVLMCVRKKQYGVWGEWEWLNPPMLSGEEYRTTERWLGKPVYQKYVPLGAVVAGSQELPHGIDGMTGCIGIQLTDGSHNLITQHPNVQGLYVTASAIYLTVGEAQTFHATLKYTKS